MILYISNRVLLCYIAIAVGRELRFLLDFWSICMCV